MADTTVQQGAESTGTTTEQVQAATPAGAQNTDQQSQEHMIPKSRFDAVNDELKQLRKAAQDAEQQREKAEAKALAEQGKYKELYEAIVAERDELKPYRASYEALSAQVKAGLMAETAKWPAEVKALLPGEDADVQTLSDAVAKARKVVDALAAKAQAAPGQGLTPRPAGVGGADREEARRANKAAFYRDF